MQNAHRHFLQTFMSYGIMKGKEVKDSHKEAVEKYGGAYSETDLVQFVKTVNDSIKPFHLEIKKAIEEFGGAHFYVLVNTSETAIMRLSSDFTVNELELFKKLVEAIVESEDGLVSTTDALNLTDRLERIKFTKTDAVKLYDTLIRKKWIKEFEGSYHLTARSIAELEQYILEQYETAVKCYLCKKLCLHGQNCAECDVRLHVFCASRCFRASPNAVCPNTRCRATWSHGIEELEDRDKRTPQKSQRNDPRASQKPTRTTRRS